MNPHFWRNKKVFLTGHTGFKGSWLSLLLSHLGANVTGFSLPPSTSPNLFDEAHISKDLHSVFGDIRDASTLQSALQQACPEIVIHMAAQPLVRQSYRDPVETYATNVMGTVHLLEAVRKTPQVKVCLNVTTDKCYENKEWVWGYREGEPLGGYDPYSNSKACSELVTASYRSSFFQDAPQTCAIATARAGNVIGGGDWSEDRLIPDIIKAFQASRVVEIRYPKAIRPWQHVLEPLRGYLMLAQRLYEHGPEYVGAWNFGPYERDAQTVSWIADRMVSLWGEGATWRLSSNHHPHESATLKLDISKARHHLGWKPVLTLDQALEMIVSWFKQREDQGARHITLKHIQDYQDRVLAKENLDGTH